jgi:hypothetical protein
MFQNIIEVLHRSMPALLLKSLLGFRAMCFSMVRGLAFKANPIWRLVEPRATQEAPRARPSSGKATRAFRYGPAVLPLRFEERLFSRGKPFDPPGVDATDL